MIARIAAMVLATLPSAALADTCAPASAPRPAATVEAMYAAAMAGDKAGMAATFAPGFNAFDGGRALAGRRVSAGGLPPDPEAAARQVTRSRRQPRTIK